MTHYMAIVVSEVSILPNKKINTHNLIEAAYSCEQIVSNYHENIRMKNYNGKAESYIDYKEYMENYDLPWPYHDSYSYGGRYYKFFDAMKNEPAKYISPESKHNEWNMISYTATVIRDILPYLQSPIFNPSIVVFPDHSWPDNRYVYELEDMYTKIKQGFFTQMLMPYRDNIIFIQDWHM